MNCRGFSDLADSYLSEELLVETNHEVIGHLEACSLCRVDLADRRELRERMRQAVKGSTVMDPGFGAVVRATVRARSRKRLGFLVPAFAVAAVLFTAFLGFSIYVQFFNPASESASSEVEEVVQRFGLMELLHDAFGNHKSCGLKFGKNPAKSAIDDKDYTALKKGFARDLEFVEKHDCVYKGRVYNHTILRHGDRLISILRTKSEASGDLDTIVSVPLEQIQVAEFEADGISVFVISDLTEIENMQVARVISNLQTT